MPDPALRLTARLSASIGDPRVLDAIASVPRELFVPAELRGHAYADIALPIAGGQTISQPFVVARMLELLELTGRERVLDLGTGSGYHAALLARLAGEVVSVERDAALSAAAARALDSLGIANVELRVADGSGGVPERAPFAAINIAAALDPARLEPLGRQLAPGGRLVAPIVEDPNRPERQWLVLVVSDGERLVTRRLDRVSFVPLVPGLAPAGTAPA